MCWWSFEDGQSPLLLGSVRSIQLATQQEQQQGNAGSTQQFWTQVSCCLFWSQLCLKQTCLRITPSSTDAVPNLSLVRVRWFRLDSQFCFYRSSKTSIILSKVCISYHCVHLEGFFLEICYWFLWCIFIICTGFVFIYLNRSLAFCSLQSLEKLSWHVLLEQSFTGLSDHHCSSAKEGSPLL